ncbi:MAG: hypothetical protein GF355_14205 [Candidatus Eisenbacteria bacterium]|nr:hypothetical protein [Candidatus Eisenbacteria bacterium]
MKPKSLSCLLFVGFAGLGWFAFASLEDVAFSATPTTDLPGAGSEATFVEAAAGSSRTPEEDETGAVKALEFRLLQVKTALSSDRPPAADVEPLTAEEARRILDRLPPLPAHDALDSGIVLPEPSLPAPRTGATVRGQFPPDSNVPRPPTPQSGPLEILRLSPAGDVNLASHLAITFSHPMVAVTSLDDVSGITPAKIDPQPKGEWRWAGSQTLLFMPDPRFPMATAYTVAIPAGTQSAVGTVLEEEVSWTFRTPPPQVIHAHPQGQPVRTDPVFALFFDQAIDSVAVLRTVEILGGGRSWPLQIAGMEDLTAQLEQMRPNPVDRRPAKLRRAIEESRPDRRLIFRCPEPMPRETEFTMRVGPWTPSAEGPRVTQKAETFQFRTHGPLRVVGHSCRGGSCAAGDSWSIVFSNPIDEEAFDPDRQLAIDPPLQGRDVELYGNQLIVYGWSRPHTTYRVTLAAGIGDIYGQALEEEKVLAFDVGDPRPRLWCDAGWHFTVLDPTGPPALPVASIGIQELRVRVFAVGPEDREDWVKFRSRRGEEIGRLLYEETVSVDGDGLEPVETLIDLSDALEDGLGQRVIEVWNPEEPKHRSRIAAWVQRTRIGLSVRATDGEVVVWATDLANGAPLDSVEINLAGRKPSVMTGPDGLAELAPGSEKGLVLVARRGNDLALLDIDGEFKERRDRLQWHVETDRGLYRPGETVHVKGWVRLRTRRPQSDIRSLEGSAEVRFGAEDQRGNTFSQGSVELDAFGGFHFTLDIPRSVNLGRAGIPLELISDHDVERAVYTAGFRIEEFRRPEYTVSAEADTGFAFQGGAGRMTARANLFTGGPLVGADLTWAVTARGGHYRPPSRGDFAFGYHYLWWARSVDAPEESQRTLQAETGPDGSSRLRIEFDKGPPRVMSVTAVASVQDVNRQTWSASAVLLVHPAELYVGLRSARYFTAAGDSVKLDVIVTDLDGAAVAGRQVRLTAESVDEEREDGQWTAEVGSRIAHRLVSTGEPVTWSFLPDTGGRWRIRAEVRDDHNRPNRTEVTHWVCGVERPPSRRIRPDALTLIPDRATWAAGDTARILVQPPFSPAQALVTLRRDGVFETRCLLITEPSHTVEVPIIEGHTPGLNLDVDLVGAAARLKESGEPDRELPGRPVYARGSLYLSVPPVARRLAVEVEPRDSVVAPAGSTAVVVKVRDHEGRTVAGAQVLVAVVDEAVLALADIGLQDPMGTFYGRRFDRILQRHLRRYLLVARPGELRKPDSGRLGIDELGSPSLRSGHVGSVAAFPSHFRGGRGSALMPSLSPIAATSAEAAMPREPASMASPRFRAFDGYGGGGEEELIYARIDLSPLAHFAPQVVTDTDGTATVTLRLPDNVTRYRIRAVATDGDQRFGWGESSLTARLPLMVRPSPPRFLNSGDRCAVPVVLHNRTGGNLLVDVAARGSNLDLDPPAGFRAEVPANRRVEVRFPAATMGPGKSYVQVGAVSGHRSDAAVAAIPVWTPATTEVFAAYGTIDEGAIVQPISLPSDAAPGFGELEVTASATVLQALTDAVIYLADYRYPCSEQLASRILGIAALRDVLASFDAKGLPDPVELEASVREALSELNGMRTGDGGVGLWDNQGRSWPFATVHAAHALARARSNDFTVPHQMWDRILRYLQTIERHIPPWYGPAARQIIEAYALYVRRLMGDPDPTGARQLVEKAGGLESLPLLALGWLMPVLHGGGDAEEEVLAAIQRHIESRAVETASAAQFAAGYFDGAHLIFHSSRRTDAVLLEALIVTRPESDLIVKLVRGLLAHRKRGRWRNTQENVWVLLAMDRYFRSYEGEPPDFLARTWLGERFAGEHLFAGRTTETHRLEIPLAELARVGRQEDLLLAKEGPGRMYYRVGMRYAPRDLLLDPADYGFGVSRIYEAVDDDRDVYHDPEGIWHIRAGARVRVRLVMTVPARRHHVALEDHLPAGFEPINPALAMTETSPADSHLQDRAGWPWRYGRWFEHQNLRDDRVEAFASLLYGGEYVYSYVARATTPGRYIVPPPRAEEMYHPETFGRGAGEVVIVE